jgi:hypothetical protein
MAWPGEAGKAEDRVPPAAGEEIATAAWVSERYAQAMETVPAVPERAFNRLKAAHLRRVEISELLPEQPGCLAGGPVLRSPGVRRASARDSQRGADD